MPASLARRFLTARRNLICSCFQQLNPQQQQAVMKTEGPLLVLAGAGSGKTTVLIQRIHNLLRFGSGSDSEWVPEGLVEEDAALLEEYLATGDPALQARAEQLCRVDPPAPWRIIAITFTNKAAGEMKDRLSRLLGAAAEGVWAMTFHSACCRILRRDAERLGYTSSFTIYDSNDSQAVIKGILKDLELDTQTFVPRTIASLISRAKDARLEPEAYQEGLQNPGDQYFRYVGKIYEEYARRLKAANAVDFDDILLLTVKLLEQNPDILEYYQDKFRYILVDEYQDTNSLQFQFTQLLAARHQNICVVGDDDQSIYKFRGATIENILSFEQHYPAAQVIRLEQNYRSTKYILDAANQVIANNTGRKGKTLWTSHPGGEKLRVYEAMNETDEANWVAQCILKGVGKGRKFSDFAVLYRTNAQSNAMETAFKRSGIPYRMIGGTRFYDRAEVKDMLAYLTLLHNRDDDLRLSRVINTPPRGIGSKTIDTIQQLAAQKGVSMYEVLSDPYSYPALQRSTEKLLNFVVMLEELADLEHTMPLDELYDELTRRTGYLAMLREKKDDISRDREDNVQELKSSIVSYVQQAEEPSLAGFLEEVALFTDIEQYDPEADAAVMMTMHASKGLEFPAVFLVGAEEGLFPSSRSISDTDDLEEERRLCYVAMTRAKEALYISHARSRMLYGRSSYNRRSRFVEEIPISCVAASERSPQLGQRASQTAGGYTTRPRQSESAVGSFTGYSGAGSYSRYEKPAAPAAPAARSGSTAKAQLESQTLPDLKQGDMVSHRAFGSGMVLSVQPMGGDALLEIAFDGVGNKRLMAKSAAKFLTKL